jgi:hypothetical protein
VLEYRLDAGRRLLIVDADTGTGGTAARLAISSMDALDRSPNRPGGVAGNGGGLGVIA